jgi:signal transduction histidine kinase
MAHVPDSRADTRGRCDALLQQIEQRFGFIPTFFEPAAEQQEVLSNLWHQTLTAYVDNPLPELFKEKLSAYLSRYCAVSYCLVCHSCSLFPLGMRGSELLAMLVSPIPTAHELDDILARLPGGGAGFPDPGTPLEEDLLRLCGPIYLRQESAPRCLEALTRWLGARAYNDLVMLISYVRMCHEWMEAHPYISYELDARYQQHFEPLVDEEPGLRRFFLEHLKDFGVERREELALERLRLETEVRARELDRQLQLAEYQRRDALERMTRLQALTASFASALKPEDIAQVLLHHGQDWFKAPSGAVFTTAEDGRLLLVASFGYEAPELALLRALVAAESNPLTDVLQRSEPLWQLDSPTEFDARYPHLAEVRERLPRCQSWVFVPLVSGGRRLGAIALAFDTHHVMSVPERLFLTTVSAQCAQALERANLFTQERRAREFQQFLMGAVGHDLRNPLSALLAAAELLRREVEQPQWLRWVDRIEDSGNRATRLISDLLDTTQATLGGGIPVRREPGDLHALTWQVVEEQQAAHPERSILVHLRGNGGGEWDADRLYQVLSNLLGNALSYSPADTEVGVECWEDGEELVLMVSNEGPPIPPHLLPTLFEPFRRGAPSSPRRRGLGLGLYIVERLVRAHGGRVAVTSTSTEGTRFTVTLPRHPRRAVGPLAQDAEVERGPLA